MYITIRAAVWALSSLVIMIFYTDINNLSLSILVFISSILLDQGFFLSKSIYNIYITKRIKERTGKNGEYVIYSIIQCILCFIIFMGALVIFIFAIIGMGNKLLIKNVNNITVITFCDGLKDFKNWNISTSLLRNILLIISASSFIHVNPKEDRSRDLVSAFVKEIRTNP